MTHKELTLNLYIEKNEDINVVDLMTDIQLLLEKKFEGKKIIFEIDENKSLNDSMYRQIPPSYILPSDPVPFPGKNKIEIGDTPDTWNMQPTCNHLWKK